MGREGDGPGEFRLPFTMLGLTRDSIAVVDANGHRILFGPDGEYVGQFNTRIAGSGASSLIPDTPLPDGSVVASADVPPNGFVWVANYALYPASSDFLWVFDREGGYVGTVRLPAGTGPWPHQFELGADYLLVVVFDDLGVETVRYYPLREPSPNGD